MPFKQLTARRWLVGAVMMLAILLAIQVAVALAAPETFAAPQVVAQVPTPTPFRFLTPTPFVPSKTTTTTTTTTPKAGGFPMELAAPALAAGLAAIGGGTFLFRRKRTG
jgi:hypothetical protein